MNNDIKRHCFEPCFALSAPDGETHLVRTLRGEVSRLTSDIDSSNKTISELKVRLRNEEASVKRMLEQADELNTALDGLRK